jgi:hypothetical protein
MNALMRYGNSILSEALRIDSNPLPVSPLVIETSSDLLAKSLLVAAGTGLA